jgi:hypothetical protein
MASEGSQRSGPDVDRVACWREETAALFKAERDALQESSKVLGVGIPALAAAGGVAISAGHSDALLALPFALLLLVTYLLQVYGDVAAMGGARQQLEVALECEFNRREGEGSGGEGYLSPLVYERFVVECRTKRDPSQWTNAVALIAALLALSIVCLWWPHVPGPHATPIRILAIVLTTLAAIPTVFAGLGVCTMRQHIRGKLGYVPSPKTSKKWAWYRNKGA